MEGGPAVTIGLPIAIAVIMVAMGMALTVADFHRVLETPKAVAVGLVCQMILLPVIAFSVAAAFDLEPIFAVGVVLLGACPGGTMSNLIIHLADADRALSVTLTAISNTAVFITLPLLLRLGFSTFTDGSETVALPVVQTTVQLIGLTILPLGIGMVIRHRSPEFAQRMEQPAKRFAGGLMAVLVIGVVAANLELIGEQAAALGPVIVLLNLLAMGTGLALSKLAKLDFRMSATVAVEAGIQNGTLAITVALSILENDDLAIVPGLYGAWMLIVGFAFAFYVNRRLNGAGTPAVV